MLICYQLMRSVSCHSQETHNKQGSPVFFFESFSRVLSRCGPLADPLLQLGCIYNGTSVVPVTRMSQRIIALKQKFAHTVTEKNRFTKLRLSATTSLECTQAKTNMKKTNW